MISALLSFFSGTVFRMIWGEVSHFITKKQENSHELALMQEQEKIDAAQHERNLAALRLQNNLGIKTINVQSQADLSKIDAQTFADAVAAVGRPTGIKWVDAWNASIRPLLASVAILIMLIDTIHNGWAPTLFVLDVSSSVLGMYVADRSLKHRGK